MTRIDITRTELVWRGKYNEDGALKAVPRVSLPFQVIETSTRTAPRAKRRGAAGCRRSSTSGGRHVRGGLAEQAYLGRQPAGDGIAAGEVCWKDRSHLLNRLLRPGPTFRLRQRSGMGSEDRQGAVSHRGEGVRIG